MPTERPGPKPIEIRVTEIEQLFDSLDPYPFRERDLDRDAEAYIVGWARELPPGAICTIIIHLPESEAETKAASELPGAMRGYFANREEAVGLDLRELFRVGRRAMAIGLAALAVCIVLAQLVGGRLSGNLGRFATESLIIIGWVANWRPIEIFLYDWWPIARRRNLYRRLAAARVELKPYT